jgi:hypothetical protein
MFLNKKAITKYRNQTCNAQVLDLMVYNQHENVAENPIKVYIKLKNYDLNNIKVFLLWKNQILINIPGHDKKWYCRTVSMSDD